MGTKTAKYSTAESISILIPTDSIESEKMRLVFHQLLFEADGELISVENGFPFKSENWPPHVFTDAESNTVFEACKKAGKLEDWAVTAYIASLVQSRGTPHEKSAYQWAHANSYILMSLVQLEKYDGYRIELCARFRLAHPISLNHNWLWNTLPVFSNHLTSLTDQLILIEESLKKAELLKLNKKSDTKTEPLKIDEKPEKKTVICKLSLWWIPCSSNIGFSFVQYLSLSIRRGM